MTPDPDFHPIASKWLNSQATKTEQAVLQDILGSGDNPGAMEEFAALCLTEALLKQAAQDPARRRKALEQLSSGKSWSRRAAEIWRRPVARRTAAAALLTAGCGWGLWGAGSGAGGKFPALANNQSVPPARVPGNATGGASEAGAPDAEKEPDVDPALRRLLDRISVTAFKAQGPLSECLAAHFPELKGPDGQPVGIEVQNEGDAPVFLDFEADLPAWRLLKMMALQTGTELGMEDGTLIFRRAEKPAPQDDEISRPIGRSSLNSLFRLRSKEEEDSGDLSAYSQLAGQAVGSSFRFEYGPNPHYRYSGSTRAVKVLNTALDAALILPPRLELSVSTIMLPPGVDFDSGGGNSSAHAASSGRNPLEESGGVAAMAEIFQGGAAPKLAGVLTAGQAADMLQTALRNPAVKFRALMEQPVVPNQETSARASESLEKGGQVESKVSIFSSPREQSVDLDIAALTDFRTPKNLQEDHLGIISQTLIWPNQTVVINGFLLPDGSRITFLATARELDPGGRVSAASPAPAESADSNFPDGELPALPVPGKPGFVTSPYSAASIQFDISSLKPGSSFTCPLAGKKFRIP